MAAGYSGHGRRDDGRPRRYVPPSDATIMTVLSEGVFLTTVVVLLATMATPRMTRPMTTMTGSTDRAGWGRGSSGRGGRADSRVPRSALRRAHARSSADGAHPHTHTHSYTHSIFRAHTRASALSRAPHRRTLPIASRARQRCVQLPTHTTERPDARALHGGRGVKRSLLALRVLVPPTDEQCRRHVHGAPRRPIGRREPSAGPHGAKRPAAVGTARRVRVDAARRIPWRWHQ